MSVSCAESLVLELHGALLRLVSQRTGCHFQGLSAASRHLKSLGRIDNRISKKLIRIDDAFNVVRHITSVSVVSFTEELTKMMDSRAAFESVPPVQCCYDYLCDEGSRCD